jgi:transcriptional regulator with XRE-family HTH domain
VERLARPENEPETPLGYRLREVRRHFGVEQRELFAISLGVSKDALAMYERGKNVPTATVLAAYREKYGVSLEWLVTGEGNMFANPPKARIPEAPSVDPEIMKKLSRIVIRAYDDANANIKLRPEDVVAKTAELHNELVKRVDDLTDKDEVEAVFPQLEVRLKKQLADALSKPKEGTSKRSA